MRKALQNFTIYIILLFLPSFCFSIIADFRQGQFPTGAYTGAMDAQIVGGTSATNNYGALNSISIDNNNTTYSGGPPSWALLKFDISTIPAFSIINSATLTLQVTNPSAGTYQLYEVLRAWTEAGVSFNSFNGITNWTTAGCNGIGTDRNNTVLVNTIPTTTGSHSLILNAAGIAVIQAWVNSPGNNFGFIFRGTSTDGYDFNTKEHGTVNTRPRLTIDYSSTLPIELLNFEAIQNRSSVEVNWQTASEINNSFFEIERSKNTDEWEVIGKVSGAGNSHSLLSYSIMDDFPLTEISYYRLKQVDFDKSFSYSKIAVVNFNSTTTIKAYPNPFSENLFIEGLSPNDSAEMIDALGRPVLISDWAQGIKNSIDTKELNTGIYFLIIRKQTEVITFQLIK